MSPPADTTSEPSIEEILDSIRQIIADDEDEPAPAPEPAKAGTPPPPPPPPKSAAPKPQDDDIIELRDRVEEETPPPPPPSPPPPRPREPERPVYSEPRVPEPLPEPTENYDSILTRSAEDVTAKAFAELTQRLHVEKGGSITVEDIVRYEVRPLLRAWIDKYLPGIVERVLQKEIEKISSRFDQD